MSVLRRGLMVMLVVALATAMVAPSSWAAPTGRTIRGGMNGAQEVPGPGDPDASGSYVLTFTPVNSTTTRLCSALRATNIATVTGAHIHSGARHASGPIVIHLHTTLQSDGSYGGCADLTTASVQPILSNPRAYYVNLHTSTHPNGAVRGQLHGPSN